MKLLPTVFCCIWLWMGFQNLPTAFIEATHNRTISSNCVHNSIWNNFTRSFNHFPSPNVPCHKSHIRKNRTKIATPEPFNITEHDNEITKEDVVESIKNEEKGGMGMGILGSLKNLTYWAIKEEFIFDLAEQRLQKLKREVELLEEYIDDYQKTTAALIAGAQEELPTAKERGEFVAKSPIAAYRMTYRYVDHLQQIKEAVAKTMVDKEFHDILWEHDTKVIHSEHYERRSAGQVYSHWPNTIDLNLAKQSLIHIQEVNKFDFDHLSEALSPDTIYPPELDAFHCKEIGLYALHMEQFDMAVVFMEEAIRRVASEEDDSESISSLEVYMELVAEKHNEALTKTFDDGDSYATESLFTTYVEPFVFEERETLLEAEMDEIGISRSPDYATINFFHLCGGYEYQTEREKARLKCWYDSKSHPYWAIGPLKKERLSWRPPLTQVYEFLTNGEIWDIHNLSSIHKSTEMSIVFGNHSQLAASKARTSVTSWVHHGHLPELEKKIEFLSGLDVHGPLAADELQIVEYVYGRLYFPHPDTFSAAMETYLDSESEEAKKVETTGDRVMTVLLYLNDVEDGGATPFTSAGVAVKPRKGSAIMWENLYRNGTERDDTWHGACPVVYGHKIVANKWIRYHKQFQRFKCSLNQFV